MRKRNLIDGMVPANALLHEVEALYEQAESSQIYLPFKQQKKGFVGKEYPFSFKRQEVSVWAGASGCGKSTLIGQVALSLIKQGQKVAIASYEMAPGVTLSRMIRQATRLHAAKPSPDDYKRFAREYGTKLFVNPRPGWSNEQAVYRLIESTYNNFGFDHFVVDNMTCCAALKDYDQQLDFVQNLMTLSQMLNVHIHLIAHMRKKQLTNVKQESMYDLLDGDNIRGSSTITNIACNVFTMAGNSQKKQNKEVDEDFNDNEPDVLVRVAKQRMGTWTGFIPLWFDPKTLLFCETQARIPPTRM